MNNNGILVLEDGSAYTGELIGDPKNCGKTGEFVFNTSMSGYQEIITDPSYKGQFVVFTYPSIGNYGTTLADNESNCPWLQGIVTSDFCKFPSNFRSTQSLEDYLYEHNLVCLNKIDTRSLVRHIRKKGSMQGGIFYADLLTDEFIRDCKMKVQQSPRMEGLNLTKGFDHTLANDFVTKYIKENSIDTKGFHRICVLNFGIKHSILKRFIESKMIPTVFPGSIPYTEWKNFIFDEYKGIFFSNGPGDPAAVTEGIENIKYFLKQKKSIFGICLGHQMLSIALGAKTYKMDFGHHGGNQPVKFNNGKNVIITAQNHGFATDEIKLKEILKGQIEDLQINPNDGSIEGFVLNHGNEKILSIQYHPEAGPGPNDAFFLFDEFHAMLK